MPGHRSDRLRQATDLIVAEARDRAARGAGPDPAAVTELLVAVAALVAASPAQVPAPAVARPEPPKPAPPTSTSDPKWLTTADVARRVSRDPSTIRRSAESGLLHGHQPLDRGRPVPGSRWVFAAAAVDAWAQNLDERAQRLACGCASLRRAT